MPRHHDLIEDYELLGLKPGADLKELREAYVRLMKQVHPDAADKTDRDVKATEIIQAYSNIRAAWKRKASEVPCTQPRNYHVDRRQIDQSDREPSRRSSRRPAIGLIITAFVASGLAWLQPQLPGYPLHDHGEAGPAGSEGPAVETHSPPIDPFIVLDAVNQLAYVVSLNGSAAPEAYSRRCFSELYRTPDVRFLDHCIAFDFAAAVQRGAGLSETHQGDADYFAPPAQNDRHWRALALVDIPKKQATARLGTLKEKAARALVEST